MAATLILEVLCALGVLFMIRFLVALHEQSKSKSSCHLVHLSSHTQTENDVPSLVTTAEVWSPSNDRQPRSGFKVISGGAKQPIRRVV
jgi:hypothetical protein